MIIALLSKKVYFKKKSSLIFIFYGYLIETMWVLTTVSTKREIEINRSTAKSNVMIRMNDFKE